MFSEAQEKFLKNVSTVIGREKSHLCGEDYGDVNDFTEEKSGDEYL